MELLKETFRWYGPDDPVTPAAIRQCGCAGVMTSLHHIPYGEAWSAEEINKRIAMLKEHELEWTAVESVPVSEEIKLRQGDYAAHIENYKTTLRNLGAAGVEIVIYNFMPVLDWIRTDLQRQLPDGTECLYYDPVHFAAFEIYLLKRAGAADDYTPEQQAKAKEFYESMDAAQLKEFERSLIDVFPGMSFGFTLEDIRQRLALYEGVTREKLQENLRLFLEEVIPVCEAAGVRLAIHPDDPPYSVLGLPRIVCHEADIASLLQAVDSPANGLCFCTGSYSPRADNDLPKLIEKFGHRINVMHLRSTQRNPDGSFYEANHLEGSVDMYAVVKAVLTEMKKRRAAGRADWQLAFRPDHGHRMLDDLDKPDTPNPGYTCIGRLRGLAEIRGLQLGIARGLG